MSPGRGSKCDSESDSGGQAYDRSSD
jgi:hypothetical protein